MKLNKPALRQDVPEGLDKELFSQLEKILSITDVQKRWIELNKFKVELYQNFRSDAARWILKHELPQILEATRTSLEAAKKIRQQIYVPRAVLSPSTPIKTLLQDRNPEWSEWGF